MLTRSMSESPEIKNDDYVKYLSFANEMLNPKFNASYHRRYKSRLKFDDQVATITAHDNLRKDIRVSEAFVGHHWNLCHIAEAFPLSPLSVHLNYVLDDNEEAQVLSFEIWVSRSKFINYYQQFGTFPHELYFTSLLRRTLTRCSGTQTIPSAKEVTNEEYKFLQDVCPRVPHWNAKYPLFKHQMQSFYWMHMVEQDVLKKRAQIKIHPFDTPILDTGFYYNRLRDVIVASKPEDIVSVPYRGGVLADVTGSGKTATTLALILSSLHNAEYDTLYSQMEDKLFFKSAATLILTPSNLPQQWLNELDKFLTPQHNVKIVSIMDIRDWKKVPLQKLLDADIVITTLNFLHSKRYQEEICAHAAKLLQFPCMDYNNSALNVAWRIAVNKPEAGFDPDNSIPLESIKWKRIVIDELHAMLTDRSMPPPDLKGIIYWGLTGTPMAEDSEMFQQYVQFTSVVPRFWTPEFTDKIVTQCFHRYDGMELEPVEKHLYIIDLSEREKQLLQCCQPDLSLEKIVQLCSYFNLVDINSMNDKIQLLSIEEIIKKVKRDRQRRIRELRTQLKHHDVAIEAVRDKMNEAKEELKHIDNEERNQIERDMIRSRTRRLERMVTRKGQLEEEFKTLERGIGFFEGKLNTLQSFDTCPICYVQPANVITVCGHIFCRACLVRCLQRKYQCPLCKSQVTPTDAHEVRSVQCADVDDEKHQDRVALYGSKITRLLDLVNDITRKNEKVIVCVQWNSLMNSIKEILKQLNYRVDVVVGNTACQNAAVRRFKANEIDVLMLSLENVLSGLDLVEGNHLIFCHALVEADHIVKAMEEQAVARIHRTGQEKKVHIYWLVTRGTVEEQMYLQTRR